MSGPTWDCTGCVSCENCPAWVACEACQAVYDREDAVSWTPGKKREAYEKWPPRDRPYAPPSEDMKLANRMANWGTK